MNLSDVLEIVHLTDVGQVRGHNEDAIASDAELGLVLLADGMGGYQAGEVASEMATTIIQAELKQTLAGFEPGEADAVSGMQMEGLLLQAAVAKANQAIYVLAHAEPQYDGMGTTLVTGLFTNNRLLAGHAGDSRMYRLRDGELTQLTQDHSLVQEQVNSGLMTAEQARFSPHKNLVTRALGIEARLDLELHEYGVEPGDIYLLCSDGLSDLVDDDALCLTLTTLSANLALAANQLVQLANDNGGKDNISVILVRVLKPFGVERGWYDNFLKWLN